jgi:DsbC/DsbD-like thiol-disulfide interchange protein/cytochrome c biogenesis protein CcdA
MPDDMPMTLRRWIALAMMLLALILPPAVTAQVGPGPHIRASLVPSISTPSPGSTTDIAIQMIPDAGWHGYWVNGGDAGFGMQVAWTLPPGVSIGELSYPVPETLVIAGLMNHVYERPYALIAPLTVAANVAPGTRLPIRGEARWLACTDEVCVPEFGTLTLELVAGQAGIASAANPQFAAWRAALPQPISAAVIYQRDGDSLRLAIPLPASLEITDPHLFVETVRANQPGAVQNFSRRGDMLYVGTRAGSDLRPGQRFDGLIALGNGRGLSFTAEPGDVPPLGAPMESASATGGFDSGLFVTALIGAIVGGLILNIMPCVFPILSLKALALARAGGDGREVRIEGFAYTAGAVATCLALGGALLGLRAAGEAVGWAFQLQSPVSVMLLVVLTAAITANLAGLFDFGGLSVTSKGSDSAAHPIRSAFGTGALAAFIATPCSGPFLGAALGATLALPAWAALPIFGGLGLGLALPFLMLALIPALRSRLPKPGPWMETMRRWLSVPMALTVVALVWLLGRQVGMTGWLVGAGAVLATIGLALWAGRLQRGGKSMLPAFAIMALIAPVALLLPQATARDMLAANDSPLGAETWSAARVAELRAGGRPLFVYFTADWCVSCKVNEASSISSDAVADALDTANVAVLVADWTNADAAITDELASHGRNSVPLYLWYPADGGEPEILPQILTPAMLVERAER